MRRGSPRSALGWLAGLAAWFVLASLFSIAPAAAESCCTLVFTAQPADNLVGDVTSTPFTSFAQGGQPVAVAAVNSSYQVNPSFRGLVTLVSTSNSSGATFSHNTVRAVDGMALFTNLMVDRPGRFVLQAQSSAIAPGYSNPFRIVNDKCEANENDTCSGFYAANGTRFLDASFPNSTADAAVLLVGDPPPDPWPGEEQQGCSTPDSVDPFFHAATASATERAYPDATGGTVTLTLRISKAWRKLIEARGNPLYRICGAVPAAPGANPNDPPYTAWNDGPVTLVNGEWIFLFPNCTSTITKFCMVSVISNGGAIIETAITSTGIDDARHW